MPGIIALTLIAIVALTVLGFALHVCLPVAAGGRRHPGLDQVPAAPLPPVAPEIPATRCPAAAERAARPRRHGPGIALDADITDRNVQAAREPPICTELSMITFTCW